MEKLDGYKIPKLNLKLTKRGDIISFGGPLLSHFYDENGVNYLMSWVDCDNDINRWLLFTVEKYSLYEYFIKTKSLKNLIKDANEIVYFLDINLDVETNDIIITSKTSIPKPYLPETESYFDEEIATKYSENLKQEISNVYSNYNLTNVKTKIRNYRFHKNDIDFKVILDNRNIRNTLMEIIILKATETPLQILTDHYKGLSSFEHILSKAETAYRNPFELDAYFYELDNILKTKIQIGGKYSALSQVTGAYSTKSQAESDIRNVFGNLVQCASLVVKSNPHKYNKHFEIWKSDFKESEIELSDLIELNSRR